VAELVDAAARVRKYGTRCTSKPGGTLALYKTLIPGSNPGAGYLEIKERKVMLRLKFKNPVFHSGENTTVRRGTEWSGYKGPIWIVDSNKEDNPVISQGEVTETFVKRFCDLTRKDIENSHDPRLRQFPALIKVLESCYPKFSQTEIFTVVRFVCCEDKRE